MINCVMCGSPLPDNQGSKTCSMCYGDIEHGKDGYYREWAEQQRREEEIKELSKFRKKLEKDTKCTPIELPDDKEIKQVAFDEAQKDWASLKFERIYRDAFIDGAKWIRDKFNQAK